MFILILIFSLSLFSQCPQDTTGYQVIMDLTICYTTVSVEVQYNEDCSCYYYKYTINSPQENKGNICDIFTHFKTNKSYKTIDETLPFNSQCDYPIQSIKEMDKDLMFNSAPYSVLSCPEGWESGPHTGFGSIKERYYIKPGDTAVFKIVSKFPPGAGRELVFEPDDEDLWILWWDQYETGPNAYITPPEAEPPVPTADFYRYTVKTIGPVDPDDLELYNGGGQKPDDVNLFLRYSNPKQSQMELPQGTDKFDIFIYYGKTIKKETFKATLNDQDIKNLFHPVPGGGDWVKINLQSGRNVLVFSVDGLNQKGQVANDKDQLVLIVK